MTFLQPFVLFGLPLVLLPVIIHLINRRRFRTQPWAAMMFLQKATRHSTSHARLRNFLILLFRTLAILALLFFLSRPLAGGWMGWAVSAAPDAIIILLDRSASMETQLDASDQTKRERALELISDTAEQYETSSHLVLLDSATRHPQELSNLNDLAVLPNASPTDTAADIPAMIQVAINWLADNETGTAELWIASDLQSSNWYPEDSRWEEIRAQVEAFPQSIRVRLLAFGVSGKVNNSLTLEDLIRQRGSESDQLNLVLDVQRTQLGEERTPINIEINGVTSVQELDAEGQSIRWRPNVALPSDSQTGWGKLELPADANRRDNTAWFVYSSSANLKTAFVTEDRSPNVPLAFAASAHALNRDDAPIEVANSLEDLGLDDKTLVIWQRRLPVGPDAERIESFINEGGVVIFFPPASENANAFRGIAWGNVEFASNDEIFQIEFWDEQQGPLARTEEGLSLRVDDVDFLKRQNVVGQVNSLALFTDGKPFLTRQRLGRGEFFFCTSLPKPEWSSLSDGYVLVPMIQRLLKAGSRRVQPEFSYPVGERPPELQSATWVSETGDSADNIELHSGIYRSGERIIAMNRPMLEDVPEIVSDENIATLFDGVAFEMLLEQGNRDDALQGEVWRVLVFGMLLFMLVESALVLPQKTGERDESRDVKKGNANG